MAISEAHRGSGVLPLRAGIASGDVLLLEGDS
jgi:class 3 adenylate cyclase